MVVIVARTKQRLAEAGATSEGTAKTPEQLGLAERWLKTCGHAGVSVTKDGRYYLAGKSRPRH